MSIGLVAPLEPWFHYEDARAEAEDAARRRLAQYWIERQERMLQYAATWERRRLERERGTGPVAVAVRK